MDRYHFRCLGSREQGLQRKDLPSMPGGCQGVHVPWETRGQKIPRLGAGASREEDQGPGAGVARESERRGRKSAAFWGPATHARPHPPLTPRLQTVSALDSLEASLGQHREPKGR